MVPLLGTLWAAYHLRHSYFFYDEWSMVSRVVHMGPAAGTMASFNGHLWMLQYWIYRAQVFGFGVDDHLFVSSIFLLCLGALHLSLAWLLRVAGVGALSSLLVGGLLTYMGSASQNFIFAIQSSAALSLAASLAGAAIALAHRPRAVACATVGGLMILSVGLDSGAAIVGVPLAVVVVSLAWRRVAWPVVLPSVLALFAWFAAGDLGPGFPAPPPARAGFAAHLLLHSVGGILGRGEVAGAVVLLLSAAVISVGFRHGSLIDEPRILFLAGGIATAVAVLGLAQSRAGLPGFNFVDFNRYLQIVAIPAALALVPAWAIVGRGLVARHPTLPGLRSLAALGPALALAAFLLGTRPLLSYAATFESWNVATRRGVQSAAIVIRDGCPAGGAPAAESRPLGALGPQISTQLLRELIHLGALQTPSAGDPDPVIVARMCPEHSE